MYTFTLVNLWFFAINVIPRRRDRSGLATDGWVLWKLLLHVSRGHPHPHARHPILAADQAPVFSPETKLFEIPSFRPPGFVQGIEILNDKTTPMEFVVALLTTHLGLAEGEAISMMLTIHNTGGVLVSLPTKEEAMKIADAIVAESSASNHAFVCRYAGI